VPSYHRLSGLDAIFLDLEGPTTHMHVGGALLFDGPAPRYDDFLLYVKKRLSAVPRYRQKLAYPPIPQGRPFWIDDPHFNLEYHVRNVALPAPGDASQLRRLMGRLISQQLDRNKPLWEMWLIEGLEGGRFALLSKTHHCMIDGISGVDLGSVMLDWSETPSDPPDEHWVASAAPTPAELLADLAQEGIEGVFSLLKKAQNAIEHPNEIYEQVVESAGALGSLIGLGSAPKSSINVEIGPHRRYEMVQIDLESVKKIRRALGGTINDVVLAIVTGALRSLLWKRGEDLEGKSLRAMIPVSVRSQDDRGSLGNQVAAMFASLPIGEENPGIRLQQLQQTMKSLKDSGQSVAAQLLTKLSQYTPPTIVAQAARLQVRTRPFNLVVTNVPGPQVPLYLMGRLLREAYPAVPLAEKQTLCVGLLSYNGALGFGLVGDYDTMRDLDVFAKALQDSVDELTKFSSAPTPVAASPTPGE
jgi:diacylglycerol O-acyltransferase